MTISLASTGLPLPTRPDVRPPPSRRSTTATPRCGCRRSRTPGSCTSKRPATTQDCLGARADRRYGGTARAALVEEQLRVASGVNRARETGVVDDMIKPEETRQRIAEALRNLCCPRTPPQYPVVAAHSYS